MNQKLLALVLSLYPRAWRDRYSEEVRHLVTELEFSGKRPVSILADLLIGVVTERTRPRGVRVTALATGSACILAVTLLSLGSASTGSHTGAGIDIAARGNPVLAASTLCRTSAGTKTVVIINPDSGVIIARTRCRTA